MTENKYLYFKDLDHPVALVDSGPLWSVASKVLARWPHTEHTNSNCEPFATINATSTGAFVVRVTDAPDAGKQWDTVNAICDLVSEMAWERIRSQPELLCLHAAAVDFGGALVVMPNTRRAGKSTLCAALSHLGYPLFTDDFLPVRYEGESQTYQGIANGVAPRVRLPLPSTFSQSFRDWVARDRGPSNKQYKYLLESEIATGGTALPLGAMVVLNRSETPCETSIAPMPREDALASLITQNFARTSHSADILRSAEKLTNGLPIYRLTYHSSEEAAQFLAAYPPLKKLKAVRQDDHTPDNRPAPLAVPDQPRPNFDPSRKYTQVHSFTETTIKDDHFLADGSGFAIHRLNPGSALIWRLLTDPIDLAEITEVISTVFENVDPEQVRADSEAVLRNLSEARLITPV